MSQGPPSTASSARRLQSSTGWGDILQGMGSPLILDRCQASPTSDYFALQKHTLLIPYLFPLFPDKQGLGPCSFPMWAKSGSIYSLVPEGKVLTWAGTLSSPLDLAYPPQRLVWLGSWLSLAFPDFLCSYWQERFPLLPFSSSSFWSWIKAIRRQNRALTGPPPGALGPLTSPLWLQAMTQCE